MALTKDDFKQFEKIVGKKVDESQKELKKYVGEQLGANQNEIKDYVGQEIGNLAAMTKRGFDSVDKRFETLEKGQIQIRKDISNLEFIATEMVRRDEFLELKARLIKIEAKIGVK